MRTQITMAALIAALFVIPPAVAQSQPPAWGAGSLNAAKTQIPLHGQSAKGIEWRKPLVYAEGAAMVQRVKEAQDKRLATLEKINANGGKRDDRGLWGLLGLIGLLGLLCCFFRGRRERRMESERIVEKKNGKGNGAEMAPSPKIDDGRFYKIDEKLADHEERIKAVEKRPSVDPTLIESVRKHSELASTEANRAKAEADRSAEAAAAAGAVREGIGNLLETVRTLNGLVEGHEGRINAIEERPMPVTDLSVIEQRLDKVEEEGQRHEALFTEMRGGLDRMIAALGGEAQSG